MSGPACPEEAAEGGAGQSLDADSPSAPPRFPSVSSRASSEPAQKSRSPPEAGQRGQRGRAAWQEWVLTLFGGGEPGRTGPGGAGPGLEAVLGCRTEREVAWGAWWFSDPPAPHCRGPGGKLGLQLWAWLRRSGPGPGPCSPHASALCSHICSFPVFREPVLELLPHPVAFSNPFPDSVSPVARMFGPTAVSAPVPLEMGPVAGGPRVLTRTCASAVSPGLVRAQAPPRGPLVL